MHGDQIFDITMPTRKLYETINGEVTAERIRIMANLLPEVLTRENVGTEKNKMYEYTVKPFSVSMWAKEHDTEAELRRSSQIEANEQMAFIDKALDSRQDFLEFTEKSGTDTETFSDITTMPFCRFGMGDYTYEIDLKNGGMDAIVATRILQLLPLLVRDEQKPTNGKVAIDFKSLQNRIISSFSDDDLMSFNNFDNMQEEFKLSVFSALNMIANMQFFDGVNLHNLIERTDKKTLYLNPIVSEITHEGLEEGSANPLRISDVRIDNRGLRSLREEIDISDEDAQNDIEAIEAYRLGRIPREQTQQYAINVLSILMSPERKKAMLRNGFILSDALSERLHVDIEALIGGKSYGVAKSARTMKGGLAATGTGGVSLISGFIKNVRDMTEHVSAFKK
jgi:hypothetical protein